MNKNRMSQPLAAYLTELVDATDLSRQQVAEAAGFFSVEYLNHVLAGRAKLATSRIVPLANAIGCDPKHLLRVVLGEYVPDVLDAIQHVFGLLLLSENERRFISHVREVSGLRDMPCSVMEGRDELIPVVFRSHDEDEDDQEE